MLKDDESDDPQTRALHHDGGGSDGMTVEDCVSTCSDAGLPLAGVEFGMFSRSRSGIVLTITSSRVAVLCVQMTLVVKMLKCIVCGNAVLYNHLQISDAECTTACGGDPHELCGGSGAINLYQLGSTPFTSGPASIVQAHGDWTYLGCEAYAESLR